MKIINVQDTVLIVLIALDRRTQYLDNEIDWVCCIYKLLTCCLVQNFRSFLELSFKDLKNFSLNFEDCGRRDYRISLPVNCKYAVPNIKGLSFGKITSCT